MKPQVKKILIVALFFTYFVGSTSLANERKLSVAELITQLDSIDPNLQAAAAKELAQHPIVSVTKGNESLKFLGGTEAGVDLAVVTEKLRKLIDSPFTKPAFTARVSLAKLGDQPKEHIDFLCEQIGHSDSKVRFNAIGALLELGPEAQGCVPRLVKALDDESMAVQLATAVALGQIGPAAKPALGKLRELLESLVILDQTKPEVINACFTVTLAMAHIGVNPEVVGVTKKGNDWLIKIRVLPAMYKYGREESIGMVESLNMVNIMAAIAKTDILRADQKAKTIEKLFEWQIPVSPATSSITYSEGDGKSIAWRGLLVTNINREAVLYVEADKAQPLKICISPDKPRTPVVHIRKIPMGEGKVLLPGFVRVQPGQYDSTRPAGEQIVERAVEATHEPLPLDSDASMWGKDGMLVLSLVFPMKGNAIPSTVTFLGDKMTIDPNEVMKFK